MRRTSERSRRECASGTRQSSPHSTHAKRRTRALSLCPQSAPEWTSDLNCRLLMRYALSVRSPTHENVPVHLGIDVSSAYDAAHAFAFKALAVNQKRA